MLKLIQNTSLSFLLVFLFVGNASGVGLCFHPDGGVDIESVNSRCCDSSHDDEVPVLEEDCCLDVSIEIAKQTTSCQRTSIRAEFQGDSLPVIWVGALSPGIEISAFANRPPIPLHHSYPNTTLRSLRSVILLI